MALTLAWVEREIEECLNGENTAKNVTDFAILCIAREHLKHEKPIEPQAPQSIILSNHCADLDKIPSVEQIGAAIDAAAKSAYSPEEKKKVRDMRTWKDILENSGKS